MCYLPREFREQINPAVIGCAEEIRLRVGQPLELLLENATVKQYEKVTQVQMRECISYLTGYSPYILEEEMRQGFLTIEGGHRIGISGHASYHNGNQGMVTDCVSAIGAINIRVAHEKKGCAANLIPWMRKGEGWYHTILFSEPGAGKTTCLRDCIRILSSGEGLHRGYKVGVIDERSEIAACHMGVPQNDLGPRCDVLDNCPKSIGMRMMLRSMSPEFLAVDELGSREDFDVMQEAAQSGVYVIGTMHAGNILELLAKLQSNQNRLEESLLRLIEIERDEGQRHYHVYDGGGQSMWES